MYDDLIRSLYSILGVTETEDDGTSEGAKKGWETRKHGGSSVPTEPTNVGRGWHLRREGDNYSICDKSGNPYYYDGRLVEGKNRREIENRLRKLLETGERIRNAQKAPKPVAKMSTYEIPSERKADVEILRNMVKGNKMNNLILNSRAVDTDGSIIPAWKALIRAKHEGWTMCENDKNDTVLIKPDRSGKVLLVSDIIRFGRAIGMHNEGLKRGRRYWANMPLKAE